MKIRVISLLLALVMVFMLIPAPVNAVANTPDELIQQIRTSYKKALKSSGRKNFNGYCGTLVGWQLYHMGIDQKLQLLNGKDHFDRYRYVDKTTGGYSVEIYSASDYSLREAMYAITKNGTRDVFNMVVGFQKTNTEAGQKYGHALVVHGVIDGMVYFVECFNANIGGEYVPEGEAIVCSLDVFCTYYERWTVFDGVAYFGLKTYADVCEVYPCSMSAMAMADGKLYEEPGDPGIHDPQAVGSVESGRWLTVTGLLETPNQKYWYRVEENGEVRYIEAEILSRASFRTKDVKLEGLKTPSYLRKGNGFTVKGTVSAQHSQIRSLQIGVYAPDGGTEPIYSATLEVNGKTASLNKSQINNALMFRKLPVGSYQLRIEAQMEVYVWENNTLSTVTETVALWNSQFLIVSDSNTYPAVKFDGNGGVTSLDQIVLPKNQTVGSLPVPYRSGYAFVGWTLDAKGTQPVTEETVIKKNTTLYAQWQEGHSGSGGWQETEHGWHYCSGDSPVEGWIRFGSLLFYQYADGTFATGWAQIDGNLRYFNNAGAAITRLEMYGITFEMDTSGAGTLGWQISGGKAPATQTGVTADQVLENMNTQTQLPAMGRAMQSLTASVCQMAMQLTAEEIPATLQSYTK